MTKNNFDIFYEIINNNYENISCFEGRMDTLKDLLEELENEDNYVEKLHLVLELYEKRIMFLEGLKNVR